MRKNLKNLILDMIFIIFISPLLLLVMWGFTTSWPFPHLLPQNYSFRGFEYIISPDSLETLLNSIFISLIVVLITVLISIPAAKAMEFYEFRGKNFLKMLILSPVIIPLISVAMGIQIIFIRLGLANTLMGVVIISIVPCIPYAIRIIGDVYKLVGNNLELQSKMLGANKINTFRYVTLPLILPGIIGASSMCFIISFSQYFLTLLIGGGSVITYPMIMLAYIQSGDRTIASLYSMVFLIVGVVVLILIENSIKKRYGNNEDNSLFL